MDQMRDCHSLKEMLCTGPDPDSLNHMGQCLPVLGLQLHSLLVPASGFGADLFWSSAVIELFSTNTQQQSEETDAR